MLSEERDPHDRLKAVSSMLVFLGDAVLTIAWHDELSPNAAEGFYHVLERIRAELEGLAENCGHPPHVRPRTPGAKR